MKPADPVRAGQLRTLYAEVNAAADAAAEAKQAAQEPRWSMPNTVTRFAKWLGISPRTLTNWLNNGTMRHRRFSRQYVELDLRELPDQIRRQLETTRANSARHAA